jgi:putative ABC transport system substrate-binding protein
MKRREFISLVGGAAASWPLTSRAQQAAGPVGLVGVLMAYAESDPAAQSWLAAFRDALMKLGWTEGSNLRIEFRWSAGNADKMKTYAKELVGLRPDVMFGQTTPLIGALARETQTIPIVFMLVSDPIGSGYAASFAHPGGNITGFTGNDPAIGGKWVELLKEIAPRTVRVALLFNPATVAPLRFYMPAIQAAASSFGVELSTAPVHATDEIESVIAAQAHTPGSSLIQMPDPFNTTNHGLIIAEAARYGISIMYSDPSYAELGGLIAYGAGYAELFRQAAGYIDRILKGAKPMELPIQQPTKYELVINLKAAKALGLTIPESILSLADKQIE